MTFDRYLHEKTNARYEKEETPKKKTEKPKIEILSGKFYRLMNSQEKQRYSEAVKSFNSENA